MSDRGLPALWDAAWEILAEGAADGRSPARIAVLATIGPEGPEARSIAIREASREARSVTLHTDARTAKVDEIGSDPRASLLVWHPGRQSQLRLRGRARVLTHGPRVEAAWEEVPRPQRWNYGAEPPPGHTIEEPGDYLRREDRAGFAMIELELRSLDLVSLEEPHRRALYEAEGGFSGAWLSP